jgi:hypothetical protein
MDSAIKINSTSKLMLVSHPSKICEQSSFVAKTNSAIANGTLKSLMDSQIGKR